jgi:hypothetical protein
MGSEALKMAALNNFADGYQRNALEYVRSKRVMRPRIQVAASKLPVAQLLIWGGVELLSENKPVWFKTKP